jgi:hypothetical protein
MNSEYGILINNFPFACLYTLYPDVIAFKCLTNCFYTHIMWSCSDNRGYSLLKVMDILMFSSI